MSETPSDWESSKGIAKAVLHDRPTRRKWLGRLLLLTLAWLSLGLWVIDSWLEAEVWRFVFWWAACGFLAIVLLVSALYDSLAVIREERGKR